MQFRNIEHQRSKCPNSFPRAPDKSIQQQTRILQASIQSWRSQEETMLCKQPKCSPCWVWMYKLSFQSWWTHKRQMLFLYWREREEERESNKWEKSVKKKKVRTNIMKENNFPFSSFAIRKSSNNLKRESENINRRRHVRMNEIYFLSLQSMAITWLFRNVNRDEKTFE